jgi:hypothetical protein
MLTADFNNDGKADLAMADSNGNLAIFLGQGNGTFQQSATYVSGGNSTSVAKADFNGDGIVDLAIADGESAIRIWLGNGDGTFGREFNVRAPFADRVIAADLNGDGRADLAIATRTSSIGIFLGGSILTVAASHTGNFVASQPGSFTATVINGTAAAASGTVTVTEIVPTGLTLVNMSGNGWNCGNNICSRNDGLTAGASYPPILISVTANPDAPALVDNQVSVSLNSVVTYTADDPTDILTPPTLSSPANGATGVSLTPTLSWFGGTVSASNYVVSVSGAGGIVYQTSTGGNSVTIPQGVLLTSTAYSWNVVAMSSNLATPPSATRTFTTASTAPQLIITKTHTGNFLQGQAGAPYTVTVSNTAGASATGGTVTVTDAVPLGLTLASMSGTGWTCPGTAANNCTRSDALAGGASYPPITVLVNVAANSATPLVNSVSASGGGSTTVGATDSTVVNALPLPIRVNAGGPAYTDSLGHAWLADIGYLQGGTFATASAIAGTNDPTLYRTLRFNPGNLTYQFGVPLGTYTVNLKFAETFYTSAGQRIFDIVLNGATVQSHFDIFAVAGANTAHDLSFPVTVTNNVISITLAAVTGSPVINAIEITLPDFGVAASPATQFVPVSGSTAYTISTTAFNGFNGTMSFSASGLPTGATASFNPPTVTGTGSTTMTVTTSANTPAGTFPLTVTATSGAVNHTASASLVVTVPASVAPPIRVNAGGGVYTDSLGHGWLADVGFQSGSNFSVTGAIAGTADPSLYRDLRFSSSGPLVYQFLVPNGNFTVNLKFAELFYTSAGQRVFDIALNGTTVTTHFDAFAAAGAAFKAIDQSYPLTVSGGLITIQLTPVTGLPIINAIEILQLLPDFTVGNSTGTQLVAPGASAQYTITTTAVNGFSGAVSFGTSGLPTGATASFNPTTVNGTGSTTMTVATSANTPGGTFPITVTATSGNLSHTTSASLVVTAPASVPLPIRVNAGGGVYTDSLGHGWLADVGFQSGSNFSVTGAIAGTADPSLYRDLRFSSSGPLIYQFLVPNGNFTVNLKFAELFYTSAGQRVFDIALNGTTVTTHFDAFAAAGAMNKAVDRSYQTTVNGGVLTITLTPVTGLPIINAIEILALVPDFSVSATPCTLSVTPPNSTGCAVTITAANGFNGAVTFGVTGLPTGATVGFNPTSVAGSGPTTMTVTAASNTAGGNYPLTITATSGNLSHTASASLAVNAPVSLALPIRINSGGSGYTDAFGQVWLSDTGFQSGGTGTFSTAAGIAATADPALYRDLRYSSSGPLTYQFALPNGNYTVNLKFAETFYTSASQRVFDVALNGSTVQTHLDIFAAAGAGNKALDLSYPVTVAGGVLTIAMNPVTGLPVVNAIEILQAPTFTPIRVNSGGPTYTDLVGDVWSADTGFQQGSTFSSGAAIAGTSDPTLYQTLRFSTTGVLTYQFTVANGNRTVNLKMAELYYTSAGQRIFDVAINGVTVTSHLDVFAAAGGQNRALDLSYPVSVAGGQVTITLTPVAGLPTINAIEIR